MPRRTAPKASAKAETYEHKDKDAILRPDVGLQAQFRGKKPPAKYQYNPTRDPQLVWAGKAERTSFAVPTLPLFVHERLATKAILETLKGHKQQLTRLPPGHLRVRQRGRRGPRPADQGQQGKRLSV